MEFDPTPSRRLSWKSLSIGKTWPFKDIRRGREEGSPSEERRIVGLAMKVISQKKDGCS
jgi:hypothetical protein